MNRLFLAALLVWAATPALADPVADTRQILAGAVITPSSKALYLSGARDNTTSFKGALAAYKAVRAAETPPAPPATHWCAGGIELPLATPCPAPVVVPPVKPPEPPKVEPPVFVPMTHDCPDGSKLPTTVNCPVVPVLTPPPLPTGALNQFEKPAGVALPAIASNFDTAGLTQLTSVPRADPEGLGSFRFLCNPGQITRDDPVVYPNQPGRAHLHQFFGNTGANAFSTYDSLRTTGESSCVNKGNRSAYWMPAMLDGKGNVVRPDFVTIYYKRYPMSSPKCHMSDGGFQASGDCVPLPNGLRMIFGYDMVRGLLPPNVWKPGFECSGATAKAGNAATWQAMVALCPTAPNPDGSHNQIAVTFSAPMCWNGKDLDSANHQDHVAYMQDTHMGYTACPKTHPYLMPGFAQKEWFTVDDNLPLWHVSSDEMHPELPFLATAHADWFGAWDNTIEGMWMDNCINKGLDCSAGVLGNGLQMTPFETPFKFTVTPRLVPVPQ